jgi:hypothetical protein
MEEVPKQLHDHACADMISNVAASRYFMAAITSLENLCYGSA